MKTQTENPNGLHLRYIVKKANGGPVDPRAEYFVLRVDAHASDPKHAAACRKALMTYADEIEQHIPQLAAELRERYSDRKKETEASLEEELGGDGIQEMDGKRCVYYWDSCRGQGSGLDVKVRVATEQDEETFRRLGVLRARRRSNNRNQPTP